MDADGQADARRSCYPHLSPPILVLAPAPCLFLAWTWRPTINEPDGALREGGAATGSMKSATGKDSNGSSDDHGRGRRPLPSCPGGLPSSGRCAPMSLPVEHGDATSAPGRSDAREHNTDATLTDVHAEAYSHPGFPSLGHAVAAARDAAASAGSSAVAAPALAPVATAWCMPQR